MEMFALDAELAQWATALPSLDGAARLPVLLQLCWHLRQRDCARALALAEEARRLLPQSGMTPVAQQLVMARLQLVRAEVQWLHGALDDAETLAQAAHAVLCAHGDGAACFDAHWLLASIAVDRGDHVRNSDQLQTASDLARRAGDAMRASLADAATARWALPRKSAWSSASARCARRLKASSAMS